jgi:hypothetical protein
MKTKSVLISVAVLAGAFLIYKKFIKKEELKFGVNGVGEGNKKCPCHGVKSNDGFGNPTTLYSIACCKKSENKSNFQSSEEPTKTPILNPNADCISKWLMTGASLEDAELMCSDLSRNIKSATNLRIKKQ